MIVRLIITFLLVNIQMIFSLDDLFHDILLKESRTYQAESRTPSITDVPVEERVFESQLYFSMASQAEIRLKKVSQKIELMDQAITLPLVIAKKYQKKQKELIQYKSELAHRIIKGYLNSKPQEKSIRTPDDYSIDQALKVSKKLKGDQLTEFIGNWEASYTSFDAKKKFAPYLLMASMYGIDNDLTKKASLSLDFERNQIYKFREKEYKAPREEEVEYIYDVIKEHEGIMSYSVQRSLARIKKTEMMLKSSELKKEKKLFLIDRLYREKEALISFLARDGLDIFPSHKKNQLSFEDRFKAWFEKRKVPKNAEKILWPLSDEGTIVSKFTKNKPYIEVRPDKFSKLLSPLNARVLKASSKEIFLQSKHYRLKVIGKFDLLIKKGDIVKVKYPLAIVLDEKVLKIYLESVIPGVKINYRVRNFLSYF
ncbi:MAG: hypothetical protein COB02_07775 [Candidatus Cloacimonadota bacterium]|nr:MAG: hypothetical protein COB02_07775 [Candidatus Cloacimonadota bacterium]